MQSHHKKTGNRRRQEENRRKELETRRKEVDNHYKKKDDINVFYEEDEMEWSLTQKNPVKGEKEENKDDNVNIPEVVWLIPPQFRSNASYEILGEKRAHLKRIAQSTNSHIEFNEHKARIEMWGKPEDLEEALRQWDVLASNALERKKRGRSKAFENWEKAEKAPLNKKQEEKMKRRKKREEEENKYKELTEEPHPFNSYFIIPNTKITIERFIGKNGSIFDPVRIKYKCHIWYEPKLSLMKIVGMSFESVEEATLRVKRQFMKVFAYKSIPAEGWVHHVMEPPNEPHKVRIADPPAWFHNPYGESEFKLLEPVFEGDRIPIVGKEDTSKELRQDFDSAALQKIRDSNLKIIEDALVKALENVHLLDEEIKMRIRFGHVCLTRFPLRKDGKGGFKSPLWSLNEFNDKVLKNPRILSRFATCLTTDDKQLSRLLEDLNDSRSEESQKMDGSPFSEYKIRAIRKIPDDNEESWPCVFDIKFEKYIKEDEKKNIKKTDGKYEGRIGLWSAVFNEKDVLNISMSCLDSDYSWKLNIQTAKRLSNDKFGAQGNFVYRLRVCPQGRLVYSNTKEISVVSVCEKTKWKYWWRLKSDESPNPNKDYIVEVTRYEFWDLSKYKDTPIGVEIPLSLEASPVVTYGVILYQKSWEDELSFNCNLEPGEVPEWHPHDIVDEEKMGSVDALLADIKSFIKVLQTNLKKINE